jgi:hypothetical protein
MLRRFRVVLAVLLLAAGLVLAAIGGLRLTAEPAARPDPESAGVEIHGVRLAAEAIEEPGAARRAFGFDLRGAGLLPVRLVLENHAGQAVRLIPQQTFLIDRQGLAWPLLTAGQAKERLAAVLPPGDSVAKRRNAKEWVDAASQLTAYALDGFVRQGRVEAKPGWRGWLGRLLGSEWAAAENRSRRDLVDGFLLNPAVPPGATAEAYLFFPGRGEARGAEALRLALEIDGRVLAAAVPLAPAR